MLCVCDALGYRSTAAYGAEFEIQVERETLSTDPSRRKLLKILAASPLASTLGVGLWSACKKAGQKSESHKEKTAAAGRDSGAAHENDQRSPVPRPWDGKKPQYDLVERLNFATLNNGGLVMDFGTTDAYKYTLGGWRTGWGDSRGEGDIRYALALGATSRLYFHADRSEDIVARFRIKRGHAKSFSLYLNNEPVQKVDITADGWTDYSASLPEKLVEAGTNYMLLRWNGGSSTAATNGSAAVDRIELAPAGQGDAPRPPIGQRDVIASAGTAKGDGKPPALELPAGATLSYWVQIPRGSSLLGFDAYLLSPDADTSEPLTLRVEAVADGKEPKELLAEKIAPSESEPFQVLSAELDDLADEVVRLDLRVQGDASAKSKVALVNPAIYVPPPRAKAAKPSRRAKHVFVIMEDTLRADHLHVYGNKRVRTPAFDAFAKESAVFERYSAVEDWTKPSCATMLTGLYPSTHLTQKMSSKLPANVRMISEELTDAGIATAAFIANGYVSGAFGFERGWSHYTNYIREGRNSSAETVFGEAYDWIEEHHKGNERLFAYIHTIDPHVPYSPPKKYLTMYDDQPYSGGVEPRKTGQLLEDIKKKRFHATPRDRERLRALYDGEISYHDHWFGDFLEKLRALGILEETLIMVVSDHGEEFWEHGSVGHGHQIQQELIHVPFVAHWKGTIPFEQRIPENADHSSLVATIFDALDIDAPSYLEGNSVLPLALGQRPSGPHAGFSTHQNEREAVWSGRYKLLQRGPAQPYLYDVARDPNCQNDLASSAPVRLTYLRALLGQFQGASDKAAWRQRELSGKRRVEAKEEEAEIDDDLQQQLEALGYLD